MTEDHALDQALGQWAKQDAGDAAALARILSSADAFAEATSQQASVQAAAPRRWMPLLMGGGAIAASMAVALLLLSPSLMPGATDKTNVTQQGVQLAAADDPDIGPQVESFALLYTVTDEEEQYL